MKKMKYYLAAIRWLWENRTWKSTRQKWKAFDMSCGRLALDKLGAHVARYYATEIDKFAIQTTQHNFPDTIQLGDAFQVREDGWSIPDSKEMM